MISHLLLIQLWALLSRMLESSKDSKSELPVRGLLHIAASLSELGQKQLREGGGCSYNETEGSSAGFSTSIMRNYYI